MNNSHHVNAIFIQLIALNMVAVSTPEGSDEAKDLAPEARQINRFLRTFELQLLLCMDVCIYIHVYVYMYICMFLFLFLLCYIVNSLYCFLFNFLLLPGEWCWVKEMPQESLWNKYFHPAKGDSSYKVGVCALDLTV